MSSELPHQAAMRNITVENCRKGMSFDGATIRGRNWLLKRNGIAIESNNSDIKVDGLYIE